jgi:checkpoint serine/threonine-protein kinase
MVCVIVHMMLHGSYMGIVKKVNADESYHHQPKSTLRRSVSLNLEYFHLHP